MWIVGAAVAGVGFLVSFWVGNVELRATLVTSYGYEEEVVNGDVVEVSKE